MELKFTEDFHDTSGHAVSVTNDGISVDNKGRAVFDGNGRLLIQRFTNDDLGATFSIKFRYKSTSKFDGPYHRNALLSNGDCGDIGTIVLFEDPVSVFFGVKTTEEPKIAILKISKPVSLSMGSSIYTKSYF